jgi:predicted AlkP superfamily pyrophosphatase or phosphodiesterase
MFFPGKMHVFSSARLAVILACVLSVLIASATRAAEPPVLIVVVSVDQLAYDYLERFHKNFAADGAFALCERDGAWFSNCHHRHAFTYTAPGHAVQLTGCYPSEHGIVENEWWDRGLGKKVYCVADPRVKLIGTTIADVPASPRNLLADTLGDRLKLANRRSKIFGVAIKDRASILMTGRLADAAYWMSNDGQWITSDYYRPDLPGYLRVLNESDAVEQYGGQTWDLLLPPEKYLHGMPEDNTGERPFAGATLGFPHVLVDAKHANYIKQVAGSPLGNVVTLQAAAAVLEYEKLGQDDAVDMLCINLSSNDYVGHAFGPQSLEVEDMTYRTDAQLGSFLRMVNERLAGRPWVFALTADHAVCPVPELAVTLGIPAGRDPFGPADKTSGNYESISQPLEALLRKTFAVSDDEKRPLVQAATDNEIFLVPDHPALQGYRFALAQRLVRDYLLQHPAVAAAITREELLSGGVTTKLDHMFRRAFHPKRSGDVLFALQPYHFHGQTAAASHGSPWKYDTHVPLLLLAQGQWQEKPLKPGKYREAVSPAQLAPTLARLLSVTPPAMCMEEAIDTVLK